MKVQHRQAICRWLAVLGLVCLSYVAGAAALFFRLPSSDFMVKAFIGGRAWHERGGRAAGPLLPDLQEDIDQPAKTCDGFTLFSCASLAAPSTEACLINMRREVVHRWSVSFSSIWPNARHIRRPLMGNLQTCIFASHLYSNGDLLAVFHGLDGSTNGYGLAKLDKRSRVLWKYDANVHHDLDVGDDGTIYALTQANVDTRPEGLDGVPPPWLVDYLVMLSPEGRELQPPIPILDALAESPFAPLLTPLHAPREQVEIPTKEEVYRKQDVLHSNSVHVLTRKLAPKFPAFRASQVLVSMRALDALAVLDTKARSVVWATQGPWRAQHDARFLENGHLLIFDNLGSPRGSRVLEYDLDSRGFPWVYPGKHSRAFFTAERGMSQRLSNGNTLIVSSESRKILEVTPPGEVVWSCMTHGFVCTARRYQPDYPRFLEGGKRARP